MRPRARVSSRLGAKEHLLRPVVRAGDVAALKVQHYERGECFAAPRKNTVRLKTMTDRLAVITADPRDVQVCLVPKRVLQVRHRQRDLAELLGGFVVAAAVVLLVEIKVLRRGLADGVPQDPQIARAVLALHL